MSHSLLTPDPSPLHNTPIFDKAMAATVEEAKMRVHDAERRSRATTQALQQYLRTGGKRKGVSGRWGKSGRATTQALQLCTQALQLCVNSVPPPSPYRMHPILLPLTHYLPAPTTVCRADRGAVLSTADFK